MSREGRIGQRGRKREGGKKNHRSRPLFNLKSAFAVLMVRPARICVKKRKGKEKKKERGEKKSVRSTAVGESRAAGIRLPFFKLDRAGVPRSSRPRTSTETGKERKGEGKRRGSFHRDARWFFYH